jgi:3-methyladenine DNA glycosylase/8-oxoguanine DNA glycosylase
VPTRLSVRQALVPEVQATTTVVDAPGVDPGLVLAPLRMLYADPTFRVGDREFTRATWTPEGPGVIAITWGVEPGRIDVTCEGDGADWLRARARGLLGADDDVSTFQPEGVVGRLWSRMHGDRVGATGTVWHDLTWFVVQQRIRRTDAAVQWRRLVTTFGEPIDDLEGLYTPPVPERLARAAPWSLRALGIDARRATTLIEAARVADRLHRLVDEPRDEALARLGSITGVGPWTRACMAAMTWGDPDTVITGDSGIPSLIAQVLAGERWADDDRMLELLEPHRPHRYRVLRLALAARTGGPRP